MLDIIYSTQFKKDFKKYRKSPIEDLQKLFDVISMLGNQITLVTKYKDHPLSNNWSGYRECHVKPDWLLIYKITTNALYIARLGSHSELF